MKKEQIISDRQSYKNCTRAFIHNPATYFNAYLNVIAKLTEITSKTTTNAFVSLSLCKLWFNPRGERERELQRVCERNRRKRGVEVLIKCTKLESRDSPQRERPMQSMQSLRRRNHKMHFKLHFASGWGMDLWLSVGYESLTFLGYHHELGGRSITWNNGDQIVSKSLYSERLQDIAQEMEAK